MAGDIAEPASITIKQAMEVIMACPLEQPIMLWGNTGCGKTQMVYQLGRILELPVMTQIAQITSPIDWTGLPHIVTDEDGRKFMKFSQPSHLPDVKRNGERGIYFFDELPNATKAVQAAIQTLLTRGDYNGYIWPQGWKQIAAGNRMSHKANTFEMPRPVANRLLHLYITYDNEAWLDWAAGSMQTEIRMPNRFFPSIEELKTEMPGESRVHPLVRSFIHVNPSALAGQESVGFEAFSTPRTWEAVGYTLLLDLPDDIMMTMCQGLLGPGVTVEFMTFLKDTSILPDPADLLSGKAELTAEIDTTTGQKTTLLKLPGDKPCRLEASQLFALSCSLATAVKNNKDLPKFFECLEAFATDEYSFVAANELSIRMPEVMTEPLYGQWAVKHGAAVVR